MGIRVLKNKTQLVIALIVIPIMAMTLYKSFSNQPVPAPEVPSLEIRVYQPDSMGWAYQIYHQGKLFIQQEYIPAIAGQHRFKSRTDAEKIAELVKKKLLSHESPTVTKSELHQLGIE